MSGRPSGHRPDGYVQELYSRIVVKIAVSIPQELFDDADREARRRGLNRSAFYAEALRQLVHSRSAIDAAIVEGYEREPQDADVDVDALPSMVEDLGPYPT